MKLIGRRVSDESRNNDDCVDAYGLPVGWRKNATEAVGPSTTSNPVVCRVLGTAALLPS